MAAIAEVKDLSFQYDTIPILTNVNFSIQQGDFMGIVGPNGSAKSTLVKLLLGLLKPQQGKIYLMGRPIEAFRQWHKIGYISQRVRNFNNSFPATVEEIIAANLYHQMGIFKFLRRVHRGKVDRVLEIVGMREYKDRLIGTLSGGEQQRIFIARTLISNPKIIFMDEPLVGVDIASQEKFYALMCKLNKEMGITLVMVSHDLGVITDYTNRVACVGNRKIFVHQSKSFNEEEYIRNVYGDRARLLQHRH
ncbi:metal ABC transporter ATP-binding protein [Natronincola ferrireducens]|uniref:Zinc transport system ATP-binding protein n=1 Tax=Natronincola ferrireducens TaxID=393762 RepID=A0A1G8YHQ3_9FIRM|nr:metal ABC transporter ATP-binding protein [Natronincola ferrireducens]SDK02286.1 zinc transport system ATP-binding protein [Natronincola ferrireducens]